MGPYLVIGLVAAVVAFVCTPVARWVSMKIGAIDQPSDRKVHSSPTPTLGGTAIFLGMAVAGVAAANMAEFKSLFNQTSEPLGIAAAAVVIFVLGFVDDLHDLPAPVKLAGQIFASGIVFLAGVKMRFILLPGQGFVSVSDDVSVLITVAWLVATINAVNLVDGLDGLAAGIVAIAASAFFVYSFQLYIDEPSGLLSSAPLVSIIVVGVALGFLRHNFHPAKIFMGDSGSMLLGLVLGAATVAGVGQTPFQEDSAQVFLAYFPLLIPLMVLAIPILDALFAILRRARRRRSVFHADKQHLHHRLMDLGHGHRQAVIVMYVWSALAAGAALAFTFLERDDVVFALPIAVGAIVLYTLFPVLTKYTRQRLSE
ncbi:MAG TPA: MraY family glycosyltransferase [Actinomycetota bacterium]|nr:MraY family glycosyltransferase [Actinomycetota bacterium]